MTDIKNLEKINDGSIDLIVTHPPYLNIIKYSEGKIADDLSNIGSLKKFLTEFEPAIKGLYMGLGRFGLKGIGYLPMSFDERSMAIYSHFFTSQVIVQIFFILIPRIVASIPIDLLTD